MNKTKVKLNKPIYLGLSVLEITKTIMYEYWYDYIKQKYKDKVNLCYWDPDSFIVNIKSEDTYKYIANYAEKRFGISNYEADRPLPKGKRKVIGSMKY